MANYAWQFFIISEFVSGIRVDLRIPATPAAPGNALSLSALSSEGLGGIGKIFNNIDASSEWLTNEEQRKIWDVLNIIRKVCGDVGVKNIEPEIDRLTISLPNRKKDSLLISIEHLSERILDEIKDTEFVYIHSRRIRYYKQQQLFGTEVSKKLPKLIEDISSAGSCYALGQHTACVFHLMRVMEHCVQRLGKRLKVSIDTRTEPWYQIMIHINKQIDQLPSGKKASLAQNNKKKSLVVAAARLDHVRIAWRNDVMHPKDTYDEEQALEVLTSVEVFLKSVTHLL